MTVTPEGIALIKRHERCVLTAYQDPAGVWTAGWGCTGGGIGPTTVLTQDQADTLFLERLDGFDRDVGIKCPAASPEQHSAMVSLAYNIGIGAFEKSSVARLHNAERYSEACQAFGLFNKSGGKVLIELVHRRAEEAAMYASGTTIPEDVKVDVPPDAEVHGDDNPLKSKTMISTITGGVGAVGATASAVSQNMSTVKDTMNDVHSVVETSVGLWVMVGHYGIYVALALIVAGLAGVCYSRLKDHNSGRV